MRRFSVFGSLLSTIPLAAILSACQPDLPTASSSSDLSVSSARQSAGYTSAIIPLLAGDYENRAKGVNDAGEVVGQSIGSVTGFRAFVTLGGTLTQLAGTNASAFAISNGATRYVVGSSDSRPAQWTIIGGSPGGPTSLDIGTATQGSALGVNDAGAAVGYAGSIGGYTASAAVWDAAGNLTLVAAPSGFTRGEGRDIDNAGNAAFVFQRAEAGWEGGAAIGYLRTASGQLIPLPPLSGDVVSYANGVGPSTGNLVRVAGSSYSAPSVSRAVRWTVDISTGNITNIEVRPEASHALALADDGVGTGFTQGSLQSLKSNAFRWQGGTLLKLSPPKGAQMGKGWAISPNGRFIAGEAMQQGRRAVLWTFPAP